MNKNIKVLKHAQKLGRDQQKSVIGGIAIRPRYCCEWDADGKCIIWTCGNCVCP
ncbi:RSAM-modified peptide [Chryseobacterium sp. IT-36CA2]